MPMKKGLLKFFTAILMTMAVLIIMTNSPPTLFALNSSPAGEKMSPAKTQVVVSNQAIAEPAVSLSTTVLGVADTKKEVSCFVTLTANVNTVTASAEKSNTLAVKQNNGPNSTSSQSVSVVEGLRIDWTVIAYSATKTGFSGSTMIEMRMIT